eukprot:11318711-Alexandrium_andersonii.AAC.1
MESGRAASGAPPASEGCLRSLFSSPPSALGWVGLLWTDPPASSARRWGVKRCEPAASFRRD